MASGIMDKLTNFLMPVDEEEAQPAQEPAVGEPRRAQLKVHAPSALKVFVASPIEFDDVRLCADYLKANFAVVINYEDADAATKQRIGDFLDGLTVITNGSSQRVSENVVIYVPPHVDLNKELYAFSVPTYVKRSDRKLFNPV